MNGKIARLIVLPLMAMMAVAADDAPTAQTEMLGVDIPDEFMVGHQTRNSTLQMLEIVDPPETVDNWTKLVTLQLLFGLAQRTDVESYYTGWRDGLRKTCPGATDSTVKGTVDGKPAIRAVISCPKNPQIGKPENLEAVLVQGEVNLMIAQVAFRHAVNDEDRALIERVAHSLKVCDQRTLSACSEREATGFLPSAGRMSGR